MRTTWTVPEEQKAYCQAKKKLNLSTQFVAMVQELRDRLNTTGHKDKPLIVVADGAFCNRTVFGQDWSADNVSIVARTRKDIVLCKRARGSRRSFYGKTKFTPEQVRRRGSWAKWQTTQIFHGGCYREVCYKELTQVYW